MHTKANSGHKPANGMMLQQANVQARRVARKIGLGWVRDKMRARTKLAPVANVALGGELKTFAEDGNLERTLEGMAQLERNRKTGPLAAGLFFTKLISSSEGLAQLGEASERVSELFPDSVMLTYFRALAYAKSDRVHEAHRLVSDAIIKSCRKSEQVKYSDYAAKTRTIAFNKIWRILDAVARDNMTWATGQSQGGAAYASLDFLPSLELEDNGSYDLQMALFYAEPLLQGKHVEKYLLACKQGFEASETLADRLKFIFAMRRSGLRRLPDYHEAYALAKEFYEKIRPEWEYLVRPLDYLGKAEKEDAAEINRPEGPVGAVRIMRSVMNVARALGYSEDVERLNNSIAALASSPWGKESVFVAAFALIEADPIGNLDLSKRLIDMHDYAPKTNADIQDFINWAILSQEYDRGYELYLEQPVKVKRTNVGLVFANLLQRMGHFREAYELAHGVQTAMLSRPHSFCPYSSWSVIKRLGELHFCAETADYYTMVPQPTEPEGVIFITPRSIEQTRKMPLAVLMELKRMGWAVIPLTQGILPIEKTGIEEIDQFGGCLTLARQLTHETRETFEEIEGFNYQVDDGKLEWGKVSLSHALWEEASINRRMYNVDYTCPALQTYLGNVVQWTEVCAQALHNVHKTMKEMGLRTGILVNFNFRLPDAIFRNYCEEYGDADNFFCLHSANGYQNYFTNFATNVSTKGIMRNMTRHPETRSGSFPVPAEFEDYYQSQKSSAHHILEMVRDVTKVKRSTEGQRELHPDARLAKANIMEWKEKGGKVACAFGKVVCDSGVPFDGGPAHKNMKDWINHTIESVRGSDTLLLIKPHPHELKEEIACFLNEYFSDLIDVDLPENVMVLGHRWFDINDLLEFVDLGLIYNGTTAVELGILGVPSVLCSHFAPVDYPVGHVVPTDKDDYRKLVRFEKEAAIAEDIKERAACWLHYMGSENVTLDYRYHARQITNKVVYPSWWFEEDIRSYLMEGDPNVSELAMRAISLEQ